MPDLRISGRPAALLAMPLIAGALLPGCASRHAVPPPPQPATPAAAQAVAPAVAPPAFTACLAELRPRALAAGIREDSYDRLTRDLTPDDSVLARLDRQPEFSLPIWDYLSGLVDDERIALGRDMLARHRDVLARVSARYGVPAEAVVAVWGVESNFGQTTGSYPLLQSLSTLSCAGRRQAFFRGELFATLRILQAGDIAPERLYGSWAGAFGQTQFMPSTYERLAVDFDGDGRRDLIDSVPDALASTANFLRQARWQSGQPWGLEVKLPAGFSASGESRRNKRPLSEWAARGVLRADGTPLLAGTPTGSTAAPASNMASTAAATSTNMTTQGTLPADTPAGLLLPAGADGPAFLSLRNFDAFYSYNAAESYGLAIAHLADRLAGAGPFIHAWPTDDPPLSRAQRRELQALLIARGHDIGEVDGRLGERSRGAIRSEQERLGQDASGRGGMKLLLALRGE